MSATSTSGPRTAAVGAVSQESVPGAFTVGDIFLRARRRTDGPVAVSDTERSVTASALAAEVAELAGGLSALGVGHGDRVAFVGRGGIELLCALGATVTLGALFAPVHPRMHANEALAVIADAEPAVLLGDQGGLQPLRDRLPTTTRVIAFTAGPLRVAPDGAPSPPAQPDRDPGPGDVALLMYTAATQGRPRGAMIRHRAVISQNLSFGAVLGFGPHDTLLATTPMSHTAALGYALACLHLGGRVIITDGFEAARAAQIIATERVTVMLGFPPMASALLDAGEGEDLSSLRLMLGYEDLDVVRRFVGRVPGVRWMLGNYGQTETHGMAFAGTLVDREFLARGETLPAGREMPLTRVRIVDGGGHELPAGEVGEIAVHGPCMAAGYWRDPAATDAALRDGWWHTGDLGSAGGLGGLRFLGPAARKELIKSGGENVYPREVEDVLNDHPDIQACCVFGIPDSVWGTAVRAAIELRSTAAKPTQEELADFCRQRMASYKKPRSVVFADALPRTAGGDIDRDRVKSLYGLTDAARAS